MTFNFHLSCGINPVQQTKCRLYVASIANMTPLRLLLFW